MSINHLVTRGYGNGFLVGTVPLVVLRGYASGEPPVGRESFGWIEEAKPRKQRKPRKREEQTPERDILRAQLQAAFEGVGPETFDPDVAAEMAQTMAPFMDGPGIDGIDFDRLSGNPETAQRLLELLAPRRESEDEMLILLMLSA